MSTDSLADRFAVEPPRTVTKTFCRLAEFIATLDAADADALQVALDNREGYAGHRIAKVLRADTGGPRIDISASTVNDHRGKRCACYRGATK